MAIKKVQQKKITKNVKREKDHTEFPVGENENKRHRQCLKKEPLQPLPTCTVKPIKGEKKSLKNKRKPKFTVKRKGVNLKKPAVKKITPSSKASQSSAAPTQSKPKKPVVTRVVPKIVVDDSSDFKSDVIFNPRTGCLACEEGRKGEGDSSCWACRLARLQNITEKVYQKLK